MCLSYQDLITALRDLDGLDFDMPNLSDDAKATIAKHINKANDAKKPVPLTAVDLKVTMCCSCVYYP